MATQLCELPIASLAFDTDVQCREALRSETVGEYREAAQAGAKFPPLVVFYDGKTYWVADGFHRGQAFREAGLEKAPVDIRQGTKRDAILFAVGANASHGLRRTNADKRRAVLTLLNDVEWSGNSDRWVAQKAGVHHQLVASLRTTAHTIVEVDESSTSQDEPATRKGSDGKLYPVKPKPTAKPEPSRSEEAVSEPSVGLVGAMLETDDEPSDEPGDDEGQDRILRGEVFRDFKRALLHCWGRCPERFKDHFKGMAQYEVGDLK